MKKAKFLELNHLTYALISLVLIIIIGSFFGIYMKKLKASSENTICKDSVMAHAGLKFRGVDMSEDIKCPTKMLKITETNDIAIKEELANEIYRCWDNFGQGKLDLFDTDGIFCHVCDYITFENGQKPIDNFNEYMTYVKIPGKKMTYTDFLMGYETSKATEEVEDSPEFKQFKQQIDTANPYGILYIQAKGKDQSEILLNYIFMQNNYGKIGMTGGIFGAGTALTGALVLWGTANSWNPIGWVLIGAGVIVGGASVLITYFTNDENMPEWMSIYYFGEYHEQELKDIGCTNLPVVQANK